VVRRLAEGASEFAGEMGPRQARSAGQVGDCQRFEVPAVSEILGSQ
jgi:hypothetical protein